MSIKVNRSDISAGLPINLEAEVQSMVPLEGTRLVLLNLDYDGTDICVPVTRETVSKLLDKRGLVPTNPGEELPAYSKRKEPGEARKGPKVGTEKTVNGVKKRLVRYDFTTPRLKGKRRVLCPETNRKGFPVWERV